MPFDVYEAALALADGATSPWVPRIKQTVAWGILGLGRESLFVNWLEQALEAAYAMGTPADQFSAELDAIVRFPLPEGAAERRAVLDRLKTRFGEADRFERLRFFFLEAELFDALGQHASAARSAFQAADAARAVGDVRYETLCRLVGLRSLGQLQSPLCLAREMLDVVRERAAHPTYGTSGNQLSQTGIAFRDAGAIEIAGRLFSRAAAAEESSSGWRRASVLRVMAADAFHTAGLRERARFNELLAKDADEASRSAEGTECVRRLASYLGR